MTHQDLPFLNLTAPGFSTRSDEVLRARTTHWCARTPYGFAVLRHRQAGQILRDRRFRQGSHAWPDMIGLTGSFAEFWKRSVISLEGDQHQTLRRIAQHALAKDYVDALETTFVRSADMLCDGLSETETFDIVDGFSEPFAGRAIAALLGQPAEEAAAISKDASCLGLAMGPDAIQYEAEVNAAVDRLMDRAAALLDAPPPESFVARLVSLEFEDRQALLDLIVISIFGGVDTTRAQLAFAALLFTKHPDQWTWLRANPTAVPAAIDEVIRMRPTTTWSTREALETVTLDDVKIQEGDTVHIFVHSSGTDPETGHDGHFDIRAPRKSHFGFGGGAHHCLGHLVAKSDMGAALGVWIDRWASIDVVGTPEFLPDSGNTSPLQLAVRPVWASQAK